MGPMADLALVPGFGFLFRECAGRIVLRAFILLRISAVRSATLSAAPRACDFQIDVNRLINLVYLAPLVGLVGLGGFPGPIMTVGGRPAPG